MTTRHTRTRTLTIPDDVYAKLEALAVDDAARTGANPDRQRSATVCALILAEHDRRHGLPPSRYSADEWPREGERYADWRARTGEPCAADSPVARYIWRNGGWAEPAGPFLTTAEPPPSP